MVALITTGRCGSRILVRDGHSLGRPNFANSTLQCNIITARQRSCGKVMFSQARVILSMRGGVSGEVPLVPWSFRGGDVVVSRVKRFEVFKPLTRT